MQFTKCAAKKENVINIMFSDGCEIVQQNTLQL